MQVGNSADDSALSWRAGSFDSRWKKSNRREHGDMSVALF